MFTFIEPPINTYVGEDNTTDKDKIKGNSYIDDKFFMDLPKVEKMDRIFPSNAASVSNTNTLNFTHAKLNLNIYLQIIQQLPQFNTV